MSNHTNELFSRPNLDDVIEFESQFGEDGDFTYHQCDTDIMYIDKGQKKPSQFAKYARLATVH